jgi:hypothetical protein
MTKKSKDLNDLVNTIKSIDIYMYDYDAIISISNEQMYRIEALKNLHNKEYMNKVLIPKFYNMVDGTPIPEWTPKEFSKDEIYDEIRVIKISQDRVRERLRWARDKGRKEIIDLRGKKRPKTLLEEAREQELIEQQEMYEEVLGDDSDA